MNFNRQTIGTLITREGEDRGYFGENLIHKVRVYIVGPTEMVLLVE